jgi:choline dehydrogenase
MRPLSRGDVRLASNDPNDAPIIDPNYMADPIDMKKMIACLRKGRLSRFSVNVVIWESACQLD